MAPIRTSFGQRIRDRIMRNGRGPDVREGDRDEATPQAQVGTDFTNVENMRAESFPEEFPDGAYGAPESAHGADGAGADADEVSEENMREEEEEPFDPRMIFFFDGA